MYFAESAKVFSEIGVNQTDMRLPEERRQKEQVVQIYTGF